MLLWFYPVRNSILLETGLPNLYLMSVMFVNIISYCRYPNFVIWCFINDLKGKVSQNSIRVWII